MRDDEFLALQAAKKKNKKKQQRRAGDETQAEDTGSVPEAESAESTSKKQKLPKQKRVEDSTSNATESSGPTDVPPLRDETRWCVDCSVEFVFTAGEAQWFLDQGYTNGKNRCNACTAAKKQRFGESAGRGSAAAAREAKTTCYTCGQSGHKTQQCPDAPCYNCERCCPLQSSLRPHALTALTDGACLRPP